MSVHDTNAVCNIVTKLRAMVRLGIKMLHDDSTYCITRAQTSLMYGNEICYSPFFDHSPSISMWMCPYTVVKYHITSLWS